jgi:hypothetical protein
MAVTAEHSSARKLWKSAGKTSFSEKCQFLAGESRGENMYLHAGEIL